MHQATVKAITAWRSANDRLPSLSLIAVLTCSASQHPSPAHTTAPAQAALSDCIYDPMTFVVTLTLLLLSLLEGPAADLPILAAAVGEDLMIIGDEADSNYDDDSMFGDDICVVDDGTGQSADTNKFDQIVGALEDFMMDPEFEIQRNDFCR